MSVAALSYAPACHHLIHTEDELGAVCVVCGQAMCRACAVNNICPVCGRTVCKQDQKSIEDVGMVCGFCKKDWLKKKVISLFLTLGGLGIFIYLVLRFLQ